MAKSIALILAPALAIALASCGETSAPDQAHAAPAPVSEPQPATPRFEPERIEFAKKMLAEEPRIQAVIYEPSNVIEWVVAVKDDGSKRYGYAGYVCLRLREWGVYDDAIDVRVVDIARMPELQDAYREYSLGAMRCKDEAHLD